MLKLNKSIGFVAAGVLALSMLSLVEANATTLSQAVHRATQTNPDVLIKIKGWLAAKEGIREAKGGYLPKVDLSGSIGISRLQNSNTDFRTDSLVPRSVDAMLTQMIFDGFATSSEVKRNTNHTLAECYQMQGTADDVALLATKSYLDVLRTQKIVGFARNNYNKHLQTYNMLKRLSAQGVGREADASHASGRLALAKANLLAAQNNYRSAKITYYKVVGAEAANLQSLPNFKNNLLPKTEQSAVNDAIRNHPLLKAANANILEARAQQKAAKSVNYPRLDAVFSSSYGHDIGGLEGHDEEHIAMLRVKYNIFNGGSDQAHQRATAFLTQKAEKIRERTYDQVIENMRLAWDFLITNQSQLSYFQQHRDAAQVTVNAYTKQFQVGKRTLLDLLDAEDELFNAESDYVNGKFNIALSKYRVLNAEGRLTDYFGIPNIAVRLSCDPCAPCIN